MRRLIAIAALLVPGAALAQPDAWMQEDCVVAAQGFYQDFETPVSTTTEGERADGVHVVSGERDGRPLECRYRTGTKYPTLVGFVADGQEQPVEDGAVAARAGRRSPPVQD